MIFTAPNPLNGETLKNELKSAGIIVDIILIDGNGNLVLEIKENHKNQVQQILNTHDGRDTILASVLARQSAFSKLAALGLTEDEIAAL